MPPRPRLRSINPVHQTSPRQRRNKSLFLPSLSGLASSPRRAIRRSSSLSGSGRGITTGRGLSRRAERLLDDADESDESYKSYGGSVGLRNGVDRPSREATASEEASDGDCTAEDGDAADDLRRDGIDRVVREATSSEASDGDLAAEDGDLDVDVFEEATRRSDDGPPPATIERAPPGPSPPRRPDAPGLSPPKAEHRKLYARGRDDDRPEDDGGGFVVGDDDDDDDLAGVGPEALEFVYGPDPDLLADVFGLPPDATSDDLDRAYEEQMERADLPSGRHDDVHGFLSPRDFRGIKRDAVRYAYAKLKEGGVRSESGGSGNRDREHGHEGFWKALYADRLRRDEEGTVGTATETDASDAEGGGSPETLADFWSEANCSADGDEEDDDDFDVADLGLLYDVAYGSHGNYSYNCDGDAEDDEAGDLDREETKDGPHFDRDGWGYEDGGEHFGGIRDRELLSQNRDSPSTDNAEGGETFNLFDLDSNQSSAASSSLVGESIDDRDDGSSASKSTDYYHTCDEDEDEDDGSSASKLSNSYRTCDEYEDDEQEPEGEGFDRRHTGASPGSNDWKKQYRSVRSEELHSSTDSIGFDRLIRDSVSDQDYFHQLLPRKRDPPASTDADEQWEAFDPFDLRGSDRSPAASGSEGDGVGTAVSFVCPLPEREVEEEDGLTAGNSMDGLEGVDCFSSKGEHVADEEGLARRGFEPDGSIASTLDDGDGKALAYAAMYDGEDVAIEVETFSNGSSVGSQHSRGDDTADIQLRAASYSSDETTSLPSIKTTDGDDRRPSPPDEERGQKNGQRIDCFPEDKVPGPKTRLNIEEEDEGLSVARGSDNNCFDACVEDVGESMEISFHVVEKFFINLGCCEERTVCQLEGETRSVRA